MKRIMAIILAAAMFLAAGCDTPQVVETSSTDITLVDDVVPSESDEGEIIEDEVDEVIEDEVDEDENENDEVSSVNLTATEFVEADSGWFMRGWLPHFDDINDVELTEILSFGINNLGLPHALFDPANEERIFGEDSLLGEPSLIFEPNETEAYLKEFLSSDFSIDSYDYESFDDNLPAAYRKLFWDEETGMLIFFTTVFGGGPVKTTHVLDEYEDDDFTYVVAASYEYDSYEEDDGLEDFHYVLENLPEYEIEYNLYTFVKNENGVYNIVSKQPTDAPSLIS
ncbi:MAG: YgdI/YgdR family lipoprotein [Oscillospiraceae bacterium]|nr:YgdI/YgdR family lipoprotein [Oscillospiraceae bacterium]